MVFFLFTRIASGANNLSVFNPFRDWGLLDRFNRKIPVGLPSGRQGLIRSMLSMSNNPERDRIPNGVFTSDKIRWLGKEARSQKPTNPERVEFKGK